MAHENTTSTENQDSNEALDAKQLSSNNNKSTTSETKPLYGFFLAILSSLLMTSSNIITKKTSFFNGFDISFVRYLCMFSVSSIIAKSNGIPIFTTSYPLKVLIVRGLSALTLIIFTVAVKLIDPSDVTSLFATQIIYIAFLSRVIFKEKFSVFHLMAFPVVFAGVIFITQPAFIFSRENNMMLNTTRVLNQSLSNYTEYHETKLIAGLSTRTIGFILSFIAPMGISVSAIVTKELAIRNIHFSIISTYSSLFGGPVSLICSILSVVIGYGDRDYNQIYEAAFIYEIIYLLLAGVTSLGAQLLWINANRFEDASKVSMYKTSDLMFTFVFQYIFLGIESNIFSICGSICIATGIVAITSMKIIEKRSGKNVSTWTNEKSCFEKLLSYRF